MNIDLGDRFKRARMLSGLSQEGLAEKLGLSAKTISAYETGRAIPPAYTLAKMSSITKVPFNEILGLEEEESSKIQKLLDQNEEMNIRLLNIERMLKLIISKNDKK